jgi:acetyl-CoA acetyltransferase
MARNPLRDKIAVVGVGSTRYGRDLRRTALSLGLEAALAAIEDAGIDRQQIDGLCGSGMDPLAMGGAGFLSLQGALGIEKTTWVKNGWLGSSFVYAAEAVFSGLCDMAIVVQVNMREVLMSRSAASDPFRLRAAEKKMGAGLFAEDDFARRWMHSGEPYAAWMGRYMHDYGATKDVFGLMAVNNRSHAARNPNALIRTPLTLEEYHASRMIWEPMRMLDMDVPVDCGEAVIITTAERAKDLRQRPVYIHAMSLGGSQVGEFYENTLGWTQNATWIALEGLWARSELRVADVDLFYPYDGYTIDAIAFTEASGFCKPGEASDLFESSWDAGYDILRLNSGRTLVTTHGGGLSQGRAGGFNFYTEAVRQLRGNEGVRQVPAAKTALLGIGSFFHDPSAVILRAD